MTAEITTPEAPVTVLPLEELLAGQGAAGLREVARKLAHHAAEMAWMARRYADGRSSYAPALYNDMVRDLLGLGVTLKPTADGTIWATHGAPYALERQKEKIAAEEWRQPGTPAALGHYVPLPEGLRLHEDLCRLWGTTDPAVVARRWRAAETHREAVAAALAAVRELVALRLASLPSQDPDGAALRAEILLDTLLAVKTVLDGVPDSASV